MIKKTKTVDKNFYQLSFNARLLLKEMVSRGVRLRRVRKTHLVRAKYKDHQEMLYDIYSNLMPYTRGIVVDDKYYAKQFLISHEFSVNPGAVFRAEEVANAFSYAKKIGFPVVVKPTMSSHGDMVYMDIKTKKELVLAMKAFSRFFSGDVYVLLEKQYAGEEYRLFITKNNFFAAVHRLPARVVGDGNHNLRQLIQRENYRRMHPRNTCLCKIYIDNQAIKFLREHRHTLAYKPKPAEVVQLRSNSNVSTGGNCFDITDEVHPFYRRLAKDILTALAVPFVGIDLLCKDVSKPAKDYAICELNSAPGLSLHMMPEEGKSHDVAGAIADVIFPETKHDGS